MKKLDSQEELPTRRKGIYILPNLFTTASLFAGFYAIVAAMNNRFADAALAIFIAMIFDSLDGRVARLINAQSPFGAEYDSLSDLVSFGVSPALVVYNWALVSLHQYGLGKLGWLSAFLYVACVALRLARFNTTADSGNKRYFFGLPCPAAAAALASCVWVGNMYHLHGLILSLVMAAITIILGLLMVSNIRYRSFKDIDLKVNVRFTVMVVIVVVFIGIALSPSKLLLLIFGGYALSGPIIGLWTLQHKQAKKNKAKRDAS